MFVVGQEYFNNVAEFITAEVKEVFDSGRAAIVHKLAPTHGIDDEVYATYEEFITEWTPRPANDPDRL